MRWADLDNNGKPWLVVAPLKGRGTRGPGFEQTGIRLLAFQPSRDPTKSWKQKIITDKLHVMHNFEPTDLDGDSKLDLVTASFEGASWITFPSGRGAQVRRVGSGQEQPAPKKGSSEIRHGELADGTSYLATVEPWHGDKIVVYVAPKDWAQSELLWPRYVLDEELAWGHAVACANLDDDPDQELIIGVRDDKKGTEHRRGLRIYDPGNASEGRWQRTLVDPGGVAIEDLTVADLDTDGDNDIIAVGRKTHNVKIYWNQLK